MKDATLLKDATSQALLDLLAVLPLEMRLAGLRPEERLRGAMRLCGVSPSAVTVTNGRFELALDACVAAVHTSRDPWLQVAVGGVDLPRTKLGAVPYAIEASYASNPVGPLLARIAALEARATAAEARVSDDCPPGWTRDPMETGFTDADGNLRRLCHKRLPDGTVDEVVRVGTPPSVFWIDRYEASVTRATAPYARAFESDTNLADLPRNGAWAVESRSTSTPLTPPVLARSARGVAPARWVTWFQAVELCRLAGKRLPDGEEWLTAAMGTYDQGDHDGSRDDGCNTGNGAGGASPAAPRTTGGGTGCRSHWGAQDMVGNVSEWTREWFAGAGNGVSTPGGFVNDGTAEWPTGYGADHTWNVNSHVATGHGNSLGIPSAASRGGHWDGRARAGVYSLVLFNGPSNWNADVGFRCVLRR